MVVLRINAHQFIYQTSVQHVALISILTQITIHQLPEKSLSKISLHKVMVQHTLGTLVMVHQYQPVKTQHILMLLVEHIMFAYQYQIIVVAQAATANQLMLT